MLLIRLKCKIHTKNNFWSDRILLCENRLNLHLPNKWMNESKHRYVVENFIYFHFCLHAMQRKRTLSSSSFSRCFIHTEQLKTINKIWIGMPFGLPLFQSKFFPHKFGIIRVFENWFEVCGIPPAFNTYHRQKTIQTLFKLIFIGAGSMHKIGFESLFFSLVLNQLRDFQYYGVLNFIFYFVRTVHRHTRTKLLVLWFRILMGPAHFFRISFSPFIPFHAI